MEASKSISPFWMWQVAHWLSLNCGSPTWFSPVAKFTSSWHEPHAAREGFVDQLSACVAPATDFGS